MYYLGIDPGKSGAWAIIDQEERVIKVDLFSSFPSVIAPLLDLEVFAAIEKVHSMPGQGVVSMFTFAENYGAWQGFLTGLRIPYCLVTPQTWQKEVLDFEPAREGKVPCESPSDGKARLARNRARLKSAIVEFIKRRIPESISYIQYKKDYDKADALCLALYAKSLRFSETKLAGIHENGRTDPDKR